MTKTFRDRMLAGETLVGTFQKTPAIEVVELLAIAGLDFTCLDAEHAPFDRGRLDACVAMARALGLPVLVRAPKADPAEILKALDSGADGIVAPHIDSPEKAAALAKACRFGHGGRGFAGSTRWAGYGGRPMPALLAQSAETIVIAQIEEPEGVEAATAIAGTEGIDGVFVGPADLAVCLGAESPGAPEIRAAMGRVGEAVRGAGKAFMTFARGPDEAEALRALGVPCFFVASDQGFMVSGARAAAAGFRG